MLGTQSPSLRLEVISRAVDVVVCVDPHLVLSCAPRRKHRERARHTESNEHRAHCGKQNKLFPRPLHLVLEWFRQLRRHFAPQLPIGIPHWDFAGAPASLAVVASGEKYSSYKTQCQSQDPLHHSLPDRRGLFRSCFGAADVVEHGTNKMTRTH